MLLCVLISFVCVFSPHTAEMFNILSYQGNLVGVPLHFDTISILLPPPPYVLK